MHRCEKIALCSTKTGTYMISDNRVSELHVMLLKMLEVDIAPRDRLFSVFSHESKKLFK